MNEVKPPAWVLWAGATTAGYALGLTLSSALLGGVMRPLGPLLSGMLNVLIYGAVIGICLGLSQFAVMPRGLVHLQWWVLATLAGAATGFAVAAVAAEALGNAMDPTRNIVLEEIVITASAGAILGLSVGLGQWLELRQRLPYLRWWFIASASGMVLGVLVAGALLGLIAPSFLSAAPNAAVGATIGIPTGIFQGMVFWTVRRRTSKDKAR